MSNTPPPKSSQYGNYKRADWFETRCETLQGALQFIKELSSECLDNGDVRVGQAAEVAMRHIWRRAEEALEGEKR